ncbi:hypothetical protein [Tautonia marina]|uniref:hypothetical protein n=1 Tax=Tautonia marina TaxID=2653855 RepID=UPI001375F919|nr:hypothetical protein [Tautonia marina]
MRGLLVHAPVLLERHDSTRDGESAYNDRGGNRCDHLGRPPRSDASTLAKDRPS